MRVMRQGVCCRGLLRAGATLAVLGAALGAAGAPAEAQSEGRGHFIDDDGSVHEPALDALAERGVLLGVGCGEGRICPAEPIKRWQMAVWLVRVLDGADPAPADASRFADVDAERWWAPFVDRLHELGVTAGCATEPARFCPDGNVTRAQMATFLKRALDLEPTGEAGFADVSGGPHARNIDALAFAGVTGGCSSEPLRYCPDSPVTRAQMATFLARALGLVELPASVRFTAVDAGYGHTCGLRANGTVACWGANHLGQSDAPDGRFLAVSAGGEVSCAIKSDRSVTCWGANYLGLSDAPDGQFQTVSAGFRHVCGLRIDGTVSCWGSNDGGESESPGGQFMTVTAGFFLSCASGASGLACWSTRSEEELPEDSLTAVTAGSGHVCGLREDSTVGCFGNDFDGQSSPPDGRFRSVTAGGEHTCGLREDWTIACWGNDRSGRTEAPSGRFETVTAGGTHTCGLRPDGIAVCWGDTADSRSSPPSGQFTAVDAGDRHTCGLLINATVECWGYNGEGRANSPLGEFMAMDVGSHLNCAVRTDATLACWGDAPFGEADVPDGQFDAVSVAGSSSCGLRTDSAIVCWGLGPVADDAPGGSFVALTSGSGHACALRVDGSATCWGEDQFGETDAPDGQFTAISAGLWYSCGLRTDATIVCWGHGSVVDGVPAGSFSVVSAGPLHACAVGTDGSVTCWGNNRWGESEPPIGRFRSVSAGGEHSCGVLWDRSVGCWGAETVGRPSGVRSPDAPRSPDPASCRPYGGSAFVTAGFPLHPSAAPSAGKIRVAVLFMDFPDAAAPISTHVEAASNLALAERYLESVSYGKLDIEFVVLHRWLRSRYSHTQYLTGSRLHGFDAEAVEMADADFDFTGHDVVMTVLPSAHFSGGTASGSVATDEGLISATVRVNAHALAIRGLGFDESQEPQDWSLVAAHELLHALGIADLYAIGRTVELIDEPPGKLRFSARFGIMGLETYFLLDENDRRMSTNRPARNDEALAWTRWQLGWLDRVQVDCFVGQDTAVALRPVALDPGSGTAMATVPLTPHEVIVIESRRSLGRDRNGLLEEGVLVYTVNASISSGNLPIRVVGVPDEGFPVLQAGESMTVRGYTITVVADDGATHTVTIVRAADG